ncbi:MAG: FHA domain-containing protein, partial [Planctomycetales bacterium]|nr:FHA domain-containing protein [Planctomycetales bacterium]
MLDVVLQITHERANIKQVKLGPKTTIGRGGECNLKIASGEISRRHCQLTVDDTKVFVCDLGSSNGTYLNGKLIPANQDIALTPGSRLTIGPLKCVVQFKSPSTAVVPPVETAPLAGATAVATPELMDSTNNADADFTFTEPAGLDQSDEVAVPGKTGHDTVMDVEAGADARNAAQQAIAKASEPSPDQTAKGGEDVTSPAEVPTEFLFSPDDITPPGALVAQNGDTPSFDAWNESAANELAIPMEPMTIPANKKKKSFFDFFT